MHDAHEALICIGNKSYLNDKTRKSYTSEHYLKSHLEMEKIFEDLPEALENNYNLPFRCSFRPTPSDPILPNISSEKDGSADNKLKRLSNEGLIRNLELFSVEMIKNLKITNYIASTQKD